jgi:hypothetical protein
VKEALDYYLHLWLLCRKYGDGITGRPSLPFTGTILEQDAELMTAFDVFDEVNKEFDEVRKQREEQKKQFNQFAADVFQNPNFQPS